MIRVTDIQAAVCRHYRLKPMDMVTARRSRHIARPRQVAMFLAKQLTPQSLPAIGRMFGGRDHTTVMHALKAVEERYHSDPELRSVVDSLSVALLIQPVLS
jgi:chromosomal replication initiator protein